MMDIDSVQLAGMGEMSFSDLFEKVSEAEAKNDLEQAVKLYRAWLSTEELSGNSAAIWYNLGVVLYRCNDGLLSEQAFLTSQFLGFSNT